MNHLPGNLRQSLAGISAHWDVLLPKLVSGEVGVGEPSIRWTLIVSVRAVETLVDYTASGIGSRRASS